MASINELTRAELDQLKGLAVVEFGANWCGYCQDAQSSIAAALAQYPQITHIRIEDGKGQRLGRTYLVKLWPTLIFLKNGIENSRLIRPAESQIIVYHLDALASMPS